MFFLQFYLYHMLYISIIVFLIWYLGTCTFCKSVVWILHLFATLCIHFFGQPHFFLQPVCPSRYSKPPLLIFLISVKIFLALSHSVEYHFTNRAHLFKLGIKYQREHSHKLRPSLYQSARHRDSALKLLLYHWTTLSCHHSILSSRIYSFDSYTFKTPNTQLN